MTHRAGRVLLRSIRTLAAACVLAAPATALSQEYPGKPDLAQKSGTKLD